MTKKFNCFLDSKCILSSTRVLMAFRKVSKDKRKSRRNGSFRQQMLSCVAALGMFLI